MTERQRRQAWDDKWRRQKRRQAWATIRVAALELRSERERVVPPNARPIVHEFATVDRLRAEERWVDAWGELQYVKDMIANAGYAGEDDE